MRPYLILGALILSISESNSTHNVQSLNTFETHDVVRRAATTTKKPAATTAKPVATTTKKPATTTTKKPDWTISTPDIKTNLNTATQVFTTLGDIKSAQAFAERYFEIKPVRLVTALKGISIAAAIMGSFIDVPDAETEKILSNMNSRFDAMNKKMDSQTAELKAYIDHKFLNSFVLAPTRTALEAMNTYRLKRNPANLAAFLERCKTAKLHEVINRILLDAGDLLRNTMINSRYDVNKMRDMSSLLVLQLHRAFAVESFRNGIELKGKAFKDRTETHTKLIISTREEYAKIRDKVFNELKTSFFPGFIEDDILKPVIDQNEGDNCKKAETILTKLKAKYSWRDYVVIVSEEKRDSMSFAHYGLPNRCITNDSYKGKSIKIFMATTAFEQNKKTYLEAKEKNAIVTEAAKYLINGLEKMMDYARNGKKNYQMTVFSETPKHCTRYSKSGAVDEFKSYADIPVLSFDPIFAEVNFIVVF